MNRRCVTLPWGQWCASVTRDRLRNGWVVMIIRGCGAPPGCGSCATRLGSYLFEWNAFATLNFLESMTT